MNSTKNLTVLKWVLLAVAVILLAIVASLFLRGGGVSQTAQVVSSTMNLSEPAVKLINLDPVYSGSNTVGASLSIIQTMPKYDAELGNFRISNLPVSFKRGVAYTLYATAPVGSKGTSFKLTFTPRLETDTYFVGNVTVQCILTGCPFNSFTIIGMPRRVASGKLYDGIVLLNESIGKYGIFKLLVNVDKDK